MCWQLYPRRRIYWKRCLCINRDIIKIVGILNNFIVDVVKFTRICKYIK